MDNSLIELFYNQFFYLEEKGQDGYLIIKLPIQLKVLFSLYEKLVQVDVLPIENLTTEQKIRYWDIGKKYYTDKTDAIKASKVAYILDLLTTK